MSFLSQLIKFAGYEKTKDALNITLDKKLD